MKIGCRCGALIPDQTDFLSYKAYLVADQDWFDVLDELATGSERRTLLQEASREMWQCTRCGVLYIDDHEHNLKAFAPLDDPPPTGLLRSYLQDGWKRPMGADWQGDREEPGQLWWGGSGDDAGWEEFTDWPALERRYFEVFERFRDADTLRSAFLRKDGTIIHRWPEENEENEENEPRLDQS